MSINSNPRIFPVSWLVDKKKEGKLDTDISIQRHSVWSHLHQSNLIAAILYNVPITNLDLEKGDRDVYKVIDGKQRTLTLCAFLDDKFPLSKKMRYRMIPTVNEQDEPTVTDVSGKRFSELNEDLRKRILNYQLQITVIDEMNAEERALVFYMGNQSVPLSTVNFLPVVLGEYIMERFNNLCNHPFFIESVQLTTPALRKRDDLKLIIQYLILKSGLDIGFGGKDIIDFCDMIHSDAKLASYHDTEEVMTYLTQAIPDKRSYFKVMHVPIIMYVASQAMQKGMVATEFGEKLDAFFMSENEDYKNASMAGSAKKSNVKERVRILSTILN